MSANQSAVIRLMLSGQRAVNAGLASTQSAVGKLQRQTAAYGGAAEEAGRRSFLMNQVLFTMRRYAYAATIGLTGLASAAVVMGWKFNASMESSMVAFDQFLGSETAARKELNYLYDIAKRTPFEFANVTDAARRFLAFGYTLQDTNKYLNIIGDSVAAFGGGNEQIERMVTVFGQIRASGRLLGQDMLQLQQQGIPTTEILLKQLHKMGYAISRAQLSRIGELGMPAEIGIPALMAGMKEMFGGASARQAQTFNGQISTLHDNISQLMGALTLRDFKKASKGLLPGLNDMFDDMSKLIIKQKGRISLAQAFGIAEKHYPWLHDFIAVAQPLIKFLQALGTVLWKVVLPAFIVVLKVIGAGLIPVLKVATSILNWFTKAHKILIPVLTWVIGLLIFDYIWTRRVTWAQKVSRGVSILLAVANRMLTYTMVALRIAMMLLTKEGRLAIAVAIQQRLVTISNWVWNNRLAVSIWLNYTLLKEWIIAQKLNTLAGWKQLAVTKLNFLWNNRLVASLKRAVIWTYRQVVAVAKATWGYIRLALAETAAWLAMVLPVSAVVVVIGLIVAGVVALIGVLVLLYFKWGWFHRQVDKTWHFIVDHWKTLAIILAAPFLPMVAGVLLVIKYFDNLIGIVKKLIGWVKNLVRWIGKIKLPGWGLVKGVAGGIWGGLKSAASFATGGGGGGDSYTPLVPAVAGGGAMDVFGEPAQTPFTQSINDQAKKAGKNQMDLTVHSVVNLDGKTVAENSAKHKQNKAARK